MRINFKKPVYFLLALISLAAWWFMASQIRPELHYFLQQSAFLEGGQFFWGFTGYPGGLADYLSEFVAQFFHFNTFGSLLIVMVAAMLGIIAIDLYKRIAQRSGPIIIMFSFFLLLSVALQCNYHYPFYASIRLLLAFGFVWIFALLSAKILRLQLAIAVVLAGFLFYLAGGAALIVFSAIAAITMFRFSGKKAAWTALPVMALIAAFLPYLSYKYFFLVDLSRVYSITHSKSPMILFYESGVGLYALYLALPLAVLIAFLSFLIKKQTITKSSELSGTEDPAQKTTIRISNLYSAILQFIAVVAMAPAVYYLWFDPVERNQIRVSLYNAEGAWDKVVETAKKLPDYDVFVNAAYNSALAHQGKLADELFGYPQLAGSAGLFLDGHVTSDVLFFCSRQYFDLGFMHESQHWTFEAQTIFPNSPELMKRLVLINLVDRKYALAEKFLKILDRNWLYRDFVSKYLPYVKDTTLAANNVELAEKRKCEPSGSFTASSYKQKLAKLLDANPENKMASSYLICSFLLDGDLTNFMALIQDKKYFSAQQLPVAFDEALVLYYYSLGRMPEPGEPTFTINTKDRFTKFVKAMQSYGSDWQTARLALKGEFGNTYWYYLKCLSPKVTNAQLKKEKFEDEKH